MKQHDNDQAREACFLEPNEDRHKQLGQQHRPRDARYNPRSVKNPSRNIKAANKVVEAADIIESASIKPRRSAELDHCRRQEHGHDFELEEAEGPAWGCVVSWPGQRPAPPAANE